MDGLCWKLRVLICFFFPDGCLLDLALVKSLGDILVYVFIFSWLLKQIPVSSGALVGLALV